MATKTKPLPESLGEVRVPGKFLYTLYEINRLLHRQIVNGAAVQALARKRGPHAGVVTAEDMIQSAREALPSVLAELQELLMPSENRHVGRKAS